MHRNLFLQNNRKAIHCFGFSLQLVPIFDTFDIKCNVGTCQKYIIKIKDSLFYRERIEKLSSLEDVQNDSGL